MLPNSKIKKGIQNPHKALQYLKAKTAPLLSGSEAALFSRLSIGDNVLDEDWDLLVVLDTCRLDALKRAKQTGEFSSLNSASIDTRYSVGGSTLEWTAQTFSRSYCGCTSQIDYIAGNILVEEVLDGRRTPEGIDDASWSPTNWDILSKSEFNKFVSVGTMYGARDKARGHQDRPHPSAELVTDLAIKHGRKKSPDKLIVHYIQPHYPYYSAIESGEREELKSWEIFPFNDLRYGKVKKSTVWERYMAELRSGLEAVDVLLQNYDADLVAITADHGEAFGERYFGVRGYKHRVGMLHPKVRYVPWATTSATDSEKRKPNVDLKRRGQNREKFWSRSDIFKHSD